MCREYSGTKDALLTTGLKGEVIYLEFPLNLTDEEPDEKYSHCDVHDIKKSEDRQHL